MEDEELTDIYEDVIDDYEGERMRTVELDHLKLLREAILIDPDPVMDGKTTKGGLYLLTPKSEEKPKWGTVVKIGNEVKNLSIGDSVLMRGFDAFELELDDYKYYLVQEKQLIGFIPKE